MNWITWTLIAVAAALCIRYGIIVYKRNTRLRIGDGE